MALKETTMKLILENWNEFIKEAEEEIEPAFYEEEIENAAYQVLTGEGYPEPGTSLALKVHKVGYDRDRPGQLRAWLAFPFIYLRVRLPSEEEMDFRLSIRQSKNIINMLTEANEQALAIEGRPTVKVDITDEPS